MDDTSQSGGIGGPDEAVWVPGIDYVSAWVEANDAARAFNAAAAGAGLDPRVTLAIAHAGANGAPVVWMRPDGVRLVAALLGRIAGYTNN